MALLIGACVLCADLLVIKLTELPIFQETQISTTATTQLSNDYFRRTYSAEEAIIRAVNAERIANNLGTVGKNKELTAVATDKACDMMLKTYFSHDEPDGENIYDEMKRRGIGWEAAGENLVRGYGHDLQGMVDALMESKGHRENILRPCFDELGVGFCGIYMVQLFK